MALGPKDIAGTVVAAASAYVGYAAYKNALPSFLASQRVTIVALLVLGLAGCIVGSNIGGGMDMKNGFIATAAVLGGLAFLLFLVGIVKPSIGVITLLAGDIVLLWLVTTIRHATA